MKKFLATFSAISSAFAVNAATGPAPVPMQGSIDQNTAAPQQSVLGEQVSTINADGDKFNFVLKKAADTGLMMAWHESHASHASHASHHSHYSSN